MQKHLSVLAVIVIAMSLHSISYAQIEKGKFVVGGDLRYILNQKPFPKETPIDSSVYTNYSSLRQSNLNLTSNIGFLVKNNIELGLYSSFSSVRNIHKGFNSILKYKSEYVRSGIALGPYLRFYKPIAERLSLFLEATPSVAINKTTDKSTSSDNNGNNVEVEESSRKTILFVFSAQPGLNYMLSNKFALQLIFVNLTYQREFYKKSLSNETMDLGIGLNYLRIGGRFFL